MPENTINKDARAYRLSFISAFTGSEAAAAAAATAARLAAERRSGTLTQRSLDDSDGRRGILVITVSRAVSRLSAAEQKLRNACFCVGKSADDFLKVCVKLPGEGQLLIQRREDAPVLGRLPQKLEAECKECV